MPRRRGGAPSLAFPPTEAGSRNLADLNFGLPELLTLFIIYYGLPLVLGITPGASVLMALGFVVAIITYGTGRTNLLSGIVHLVLLATYVFTVFAP